MNKRTKVLVWKAHGDIRVYDISSPDKFKKLIIDMITPMFECLDNWGLEHTIKLVLEHIEKHPDDMKALTRAFNSLKDGIGEGSGMFEDIFITELE